LIALGTDSLASNHQLSIIEEIKTIRRHFPHIPTDQLLRWATSNGSKALQMENLLGSFEKGKQPGVILCDNQFSRSRRLL
jgi:cytosine/adenosine deaminase-related metal-dependent hydrolase